MIGTTTMQMQAKVGSALARWLGQLLVIAEPRLWLVHVDGRWIGCVERDHAGFKVEWLETAPEMLRTETITAPDVDAMAHRIGALVGSSRSLRLVPVSD